MRVLDLGCGPGTLTLPLAKFSREVIAIDIDKGMILEGRKQAKQAKLKNIKWIVSPAEKVNTKLGKFDIIAFSNSLHWMDRNKVLTLAKKMLAEKGIIVLVSGHSWWNSKMKVSWHAQVINVLKKHLGEKRRAGRGFYKKSNDEKDNEDRFEKLLPRSGFKIILSKEVPLKYQMSIDDIVNFLYTSSFAAKHLFKGRHQVFERDLRIELQKLNRTGKFAERTYFSLFICKRNSTD